VGTPLADVAASLGYESASAFSAMFKRALGRPPSTFFAGEAK
jgi:AraC-like DNA-binding protein